VSQGESGSGQVDRGDEVVGVGVEGQADGPGPTRPSVTPRNPFTSATSVHPSVAAVTPIVATDGS